MAVRIGEVVDLRAEARARDRAGPDAESLEPLDLLLEVLRRQLEAHGPADLAAAVGIPCQDEERLLLEHEERAVSVLALVVGRGRAVAEQAGVEVDRAVEV